MAEDRMNARRPLVGVAPSCVDGRPTVRHFYLDAIWEAGGLGVILPYTTDAGRVAAYADLFDGFLFSGGVDLDPVLYGETKQFDSVEIDHARDAFEAALFGAVYPTKKPVLGICRGIQAINVFLGGTLHQHIEGHSQNKPGECPRREGNATGTPAEHPPGRPQLITPVTGGMLHRICGEKPFYVNTFHHQAIKDVAPALRVDAYAPDGHIEAVYAPDHPFLLAVQFHPEIFHTAREASAIFEAFVSHLF